MTNTSNRTDADAKNACQAWRHTINRLARRTQSGRCNVGLDGRACRSEGPLYEGGQGESGPGLGPTAALMAAQAVPVALLRVGLAAAPIMAH